MRNESNPPDEIPPRRGTARASSLRTTRLQLGRSLRSVASEVGVDPAHLSRIERGSSQLTVDLLFRLATVLELGELAKHLKPFIPRREDDASTD